MPGDQVILCGPPTCRPDFDGEALILDNTPVTGNVNLKVEDVSKGLAEKVPTVFHDLIDIATYVYCADQAIKRYGTEALGEHWRRQFHFNIPVREPDLWATPEVLEDLVSTLSFLSDDEYSFNFSLLREPHAAQRLFEFGQTPLEGYVHGVMLFSGGIDSLGGAVQESIVDRRRVVLVNHRSNEKLTPRHEMLLRSLREKTGSFNPIHLRVRINKDERLSQDYTQRSRSFLCAALGATVASMVGLRKIRFYENGVISLNLPPSPQVVGARATRTTHPRVLAGMASLLSRITEKPFEIENPFLWKTKTDIVRLLAEYGCAALIEHSFSCASPRRSSLECSHCGECSQCIDRRFAVLAAHQEAHDPASSYRIDLLTGSRGDGLHRAMLAAYVDMAIRVRQMSELDFFTTYGEACRVLQHVDCECQTAAARILDLYRRHATEVGRVIEEGIARHSSDLLLRRLPPDCLIRLMLDRESVRDTGLDEPEAQRNFIKRSGSAWVIGFGRQAAKHYPDNIGFAYLDFLFQHPGHEFNANDLDAAVRQQRLGAPPNTVTENQIESRHEGFNSSGHADVIIDEHTVKEYLERLNAIDERIKQCNTDYDAAAVDEADELAWERAQILSELQPTRGIFGKNVELNSVRNRARHRVCKAIRRALAHFETKNQLLFEHLQPPTLSLGNAICYAPAEDPNWVSLSEESAVPA